MRHPRNLTLWAAAWSCALGIAATGCSLSHTEDGGTTAPETTPVSGDVEGGERIDQLLATASDAEARGELRDADATYARVLELDPNNPQAAEGQRRVRQAGGIAPEPRAQEIPPSEEVDEITAASAETEQVRREQVRIEAESRLRQGEVALAAGDHDRAIRLFEAALLAVQYRPFLVGGELTEPAIEARIAAARDAKADAERKSEIERQTRIARENEQREAEERARQEFKIRALFEAADQAYVDDRFALAENYLGEILAIDPANNDARQLKELARDARMQAVDRDHRESYKRNWRQTFAELTADLRPQVDLVEHPDAKKWREIEARGPLQFTVQDDLISPAEREILDKLRSSTIPLNFSEATLSQAIDWFRANTGVNFLISATIRNSGDEPTFTVNVGAMRALEALDLLLSLSTTPLVRRIENGVVSILTAEEAKGGQILEIFDIRDLIKVVRNFPAKDFNLTPSGFQPDDLGGDTADPQPLVFEGERLVELIRTNIAKDSWEADPANTVTVVSGALVVHQNRDVQSLIRTLLDDLRRSAGTLVNIESRFITVSDSFLEDIGVDFRGLGPPDLANPDAAFPSGLVLDDFGSIPDGFGTVANPSGIGTKNDLGIFFDEGEGDGDVRARVENLYDSTLGSNQFGGSPFTNSGGLSLQWEMLDLGGTFLDETMAQAVLRAVSKYGTSNIVDAPSLTVYNGQRASINVTNYVSYVKDFDVEIAQAAVIADPVVDVIADGVVLDVRPVVSADRRFVTMELRPTIATLQRPIGTFSTTLGIGTSVLIELPQLTLQRARTTVTMPDGATLMLGGWKLIEDQDFDSGIPFLNKIPVLSFIFGRKGKFLNKQKLVIMVKARIVIPEEAEPAMPAIAGN
jgi:general secretion pathway protein D